MNLVHRSVGYRSVGSRLEVGWIEEEVARIEVVAGSMEVSMVDPRSTPTHTCIQNTNEKSKIKNAVMKCGPEKGDWVVVR